LILSTPGIFFRSNSCLRPNGMVASILSRNVM